MMSPYENLANTIVLQAVRDYRKALRALKNNPQNITAQDTKREVERFFLSGWFAKLTDIDAEFLIRKLNEEVG